MLIIQDFKKFIQKNYWIVKEVVTFLIDGLILITGISDLLINFLAFDPKKFKSKLSSPFVIIIIKSALNIFCVINY